MDLILLFSSAIGLVVISGLGVYPNSFCFSFLNTGLDNSSFNLLGLLSEFLFKLLFSSCFIFFKDLFLWK